MPRLGWLLGRLLQIVPTFLLIGIAVFVAVVAAFFLIADGDEDDTPVSV